MPRALAVWPGFLAAYLFAVASIAQEVVPHHQDRMPGPALSPQEAIAKMTVPAGFTVELVASEPDIVNPVAMTFDERGRIWITESLEYPRKQPGPGRDRIKVLEDTDGDGKADNFTIFADGFNIPSGIAVGYGGVWVANSPDILFLQDTDGDGKADKQERIVTGFGRSDTHELPNSLTWGPDGWLYGLNGVFNHSHVKYAKENPNFNDDHPGWQFTCALWRIHPRTREFQVFCEGTSNPWGIAIDPEGSFFVSACVIDHLWHLVETGYYHRQGGPYPAFTWKIDSIVKHAHQKAAYCGIHYFDSDAYPEQYRGKLYMGNIHGNCINCDKLQRDGSTYFATGEPDFLTADDAWFMPVSQKTGPDGCLYILDWYDRYHCYQDANRDPAGIDRLKGRLYRVRYKETPRAKGFDLSKETDDQLINRLAWRNDYIRQTAQRLLAERGSAATRANLWKVASDQAAGRKTRLHALWALIGAGGVESEWHQALLDNKDATFRAWGVRLAANMGQVPNTIKQRVQNLASDSSPDVQLQVAIAARKIAGLRRRQADPSHRLAELALAARLGYHPFARASGKARRGRRSRVSSDGAFPCQAALGDSRIAAVVVRALDNFIAQAVFSRWTAGFVGGAFARHPKRPTPGRTIEIASTCIDARIAIAGKRGLSGIAPSSLCPNDVGRRRCGNCLPPRISK
jgi:glucose/arabinose dehydrogenase